MIPPTAFRTEVRRAVQAVLRARGSIDNENWAEAADEIADAVLDSGLEEEESAAWVPPAVIKGAVGEIVGPPIAGTDDRINAGPGEVDGEDPATTPLPSWPATAPVSGEIITGDVPGPPRKAAPEWRPAGEVGMVTGAGTSVVEEPRNDARPIDGEARGPVMVDVAKLDGSPRQLPSGTWMVPEGYSGGAPGVCRSCGAEIVWATSPHGKPAPLNPDGESHFATCPDAMRWRKRER